MQDDNPKILILSSANPAKGPGIVAADYYDAFKDQGYDVDVLTLNKSESRPEFLYIHNFNKLYEPIYYKIRADFKLVCRLFRAIFHNCQINPKDGYDFFYFEEEKPPIRISKILSKIHKQYDIVFILFGQEMISFATVREIYRKLRCTIIFGGVDYSHMSGGCHFVGECKNYKTGCGCCPAFGSKNPHDFTRHNVIYRKKVYEEVKPIVLGNSYMLSFYKESYLLKDYPCFISMPIIDTTLFKPMDRFMLHDYFRISQSKTFKILFGCQRIADERKGVSYLVEALNTFYSNLTEKEHSNVLIMAIGNNFKYVQTKLNGFDTYDFGYVSTEQLAKLYAFADVFLCPSIDDAGPMMVNQSLCCGTPVVGFEMGACLDAVKGKGTGYCAKLRDTQEFAKGIELLFRQSAEERESMRSHCVEFAQSTYSYGAAVNRILKVYKQHNKADEA